MTTYYPAPSGVYKRMTTTGNTHLARDNGGTVYIGENQSPAGTPLIVNGDMHVGLQSGATIHATGAIQPGDDQTLVCAAGSQGAIRWNKTSQALEVCNGVGNWQTVGGITGVTCPTDWGCSVGGSNIVISPPSNVIGAVNNISGDTISQNPQTFKIIYNHVIPSPIYLCPAVPNIYAGVACNFYSNCPYGVPGPSSSCVGQNGASATCMYYRFQMTSCWQWCHSPTLLGYTGPVATTLYCTQIN